MSEERPTRPDGPIVSLGVSVLMAYSLVYAFGTLAVIAGADFRFSVGELAFLVGRPFAMAAAMGVILLFHRRLAGRWNPYGGLAVAAVLAGAIYWTLPAHPIDGSLVNAFVGLLLCDVLRLRFPSTRARRLVLLAAVLPLALLVANLAARSSDTARVNRLGLVAYPPFSTLATPAVDNEAKDAYPPCTFRYNSLGYRDEEPAPPAAGQTRLLLVGDSFLWGDGIPTNEETLGARLRGELERQAAGRHTVAVAAFPGNNLYGYVRTAVAMGAYWRPDVILVGYLGDTDPFDAQWLVDQLPGNEVARQFVLSLRIPMDIYRLVSSAEYRERRSGEHAVRTEVAIAVLRTLAKSLRARIVFLHYFGLKPDGPVSQAGFGNLELPEHLRYPGHANVHWYGKDKHPKPGLNAILGRWLADWILTSLASPEPAGASTGSGTCPDPEAHSVDGA